MKKIYLLPIKAYQFFSRMFPASCRYYPTCSEYAKWQFSLNSPTKAFFNTFLRISRCNQLFLGGIDYPLIKSKFKMPIKKQGKIKIIYWFVPKKGKIDYYYIIKDYNAIKSTT